MPELSTFMVSSLDLTYLDIFMKAWAM